MSSGVAISIILFLMMWVVDAQLSRIAKALERLADRAEGKIDNWK